MQIHMGENCTAVSAGEEHLRLSSSIQVVSSLYPILNSTVPCVTYGSKPMINNTYNNSNLWGIYIGNVYTEVNKNRNSYSCLPQC